MHTTSIEVSLYKIHSFIVALLANFYLLDNSSDKGTFVDYKYRVKILG